ncbi:zinc finger protein ZFP2 [Tribolium castaneum]|uniref:Zinc finger protein 585B-like Protein n=1 Tax=Tribolium castaneum TaxID=7070 RepID=A0A139WKF5_TRICA|nr:PREDICTED: zinc finger protein 2-like [Tribolium castaneum]KYB28406.1 Zinc finger protein 585B-like Protein [Tribolium castaneum]|eukprot:XP_008194012.1 PREDICTED: zinc finger protein 2-like [Tribolium castaneum]
MFTEPVFDNKWQKCKFCSSTFEELSDYLTHIELVHKNHKTNYLLSSFMCSDCGKQYKTKNELTNHINSKCGTVKQFKCKICGQELMSAGSLYNHMLRHNGVRSFMCRFCAKLFFTAGQLKVHERIHTQDKAYVCEVCNKGFCHRQSLITHSTIHTGIKPYQCENCGNSFSCVGNLIKHRKTHADTCGLIPLTTHRVKHPSTKIKVKINTPSNSRLKTNGQMDFEVQLEVEKELNILKSALCRNNKTEGKKEATNDEQCAKQNLIDKIQECIQRSDTEESLSENNSNENVEKNTALNDTPKEVAQEITLSTGGGVKSTKRRHVERDRNYENEISKFTEQTNFDDEGFGDCKYCGKRYMNVRWLYKHVKEHENNIPIGSDQSGIPLHKCSCCKMSFYTKEESLIHQQTHHADILTCHECEKIFSNRDSLRSHQKVFHKGVGRKAYIYVCDKCGKQFKQKSYLKAHEERNCDKGPFYECSICQKQFSSVYTRNNHMRVHDPEKKLLCKFCAKSFHWKGQLKIHERSHTGEKPFACLYCPKAFAYRESLITHSTIHTGIKPHLCEGCGARFSCIGNLIKHRSSHANECGAWAYKTQKPLQSN